MYDSDWVTSLRLATFAAVFTTALYGCDPSSQTGDPMAPAPAEGKADGSAELDGGASLAADARVDLVADAGEAETDAGPFVEAPDGATGDLDGGAAPLRTAERLAIARTSAYAPGTRLRPVVIRSADGGAEQLARFFDAELEAICDFASIAGTEDFACTPGHLTLRLYDDAECTESVFVPRNSSEEAQEPTLVGTYIPAIGSSGPCAGRSAQLAIDPIEVTERVSDIEMTYRISNEGECVEAGPNPLVFRGRPASPDVFVRGEMHLVDGGDGHAGRVVLGDDGSFRWGTREEQTKAWSTDHESTTVFESAREAYVLESRALYETGRRVAFYVDDSCDELGAFRVKRPWTDACPLAAVREDLENGTIRWSEVGAAIPEADVRSSFGDRCVPFRGDPLPFEVYEVGAPLEPSGTYPIRFGERGEGRLRTVDALDADGDVIARDLTFRDTELDVTCIPATTTAGPRCTPTLTLRERRTGRYFGDDACEAAPLVSESSSYAEGRMLAVYQSGSVVVGGLRLGALHTGEAYELADGECTPLMGDQTLRTATPVGLDAFAVVGITTTE